MEPIQQILIREKQVKNYIYLYKVDCFWIAYERSAFYLYSICSVDHIFRYFDAKSFNTIAIAVLKSNYKNLNPQLEIIKDSEEQLVLSCGITCKGFEHWKNVLSFSRNEDKCVKGIVWDRHHLIPKELKSN